MEFLIPALLAGIGVALIAAPLGAFIVWQRLAYMGDTLAHSSLLGVAFSLLLSTDVQLGIVIVCVMVALILLAWQDQRQLPTDTILGIISHSALAVGLIFISLFDGTRLNLSAYLLGDILTTTERDVFLIYALAVVVAALIRYFWTPLLSLTVSPELAQVEGVPVKRLRLLLLLLVALTIAFAIQVVGVLLITALLIIPAASARQFARTPEAMVLFTGLIAVISVVGGLLVSLFWDIPAGPAVISFSSLLFALSLGLKKAN
jgi:zinc transport system permease protein